MHTLYRYPLLASLLAVGAFFPLLAKSDELPPDIQEITQTIRQTASANSIQSGSIEASFDQTARIWTANISGNYQGEGAQIKNMFVYGKDAYGTIRDEWTVSTDYPELADPPFTLSFPIPKPDPDWTEIGVGITLMDNHGSTTKVLSTPFPIIWQDPVLIEHAWSGSLVIAPNYDRGGVPSGVGIPHILINSIPAGDYYGVVFFDHDGCPSGNYLVNSFRPGIEWGDDVLGFGYAKAFSTKGGGCMQKFHLDPRKDGDWLWGALDPNGSANQLADADGIPAFAICASAKACDPIMARERTLPATTTATSNATHAVSSVLFLPGIKGSMLYEDNPFCLIVSDSCGIALWPPLADITMPELFLNAGGKSKRNIFVRDGGVLGSAYGQSFYDSFTRTLDAAHDAGTFGPGWSWKAAAYDWRLSLPDIVSGGAADGKRIFFGVSSSAPYLERTLRGLASSSPTGKVTVVAHSNGGLVAKALMESLGDTLAAQLIDAVIFVGVPQSGAPRALGALLYGEQEGLPGLQQVPDFMMSAAHAREFSLNSPMAYHLLPSAMYLGALQPNQPLISFGDGDVLAIDRQSYGEKITTASALQAFAMAEGGDRAMPKKDDLHLANILNPALLSYAQKTHAVLDAWQPPAGIEAYQLGGYDVDTISGIELYEARHKDKVPTIAYRPQFTEDGDGTVPVISSLMMNAAAHVHQVWLDLPSMRSGAVSYSHANMLDASDVQEVIGNILHSSSIFPSTAHAMDIPAPSKSGKRLAFYVHSPVSLTLRSENGQQAKVGTNGTTQDIPGSTAGVFGDVKYVLVPANGTTYTLLLSGEGTGTFSLDLQELDSDRTVASSTIADVPVTNDTQAALTIRDTIENASPLMIDEDGNGSIDYRIAPKVGETTFLDTRTQTPASTQAIPTLSRSFGGAVPVSASTTSPAPFIQTLLAHAASPIASAKRAVAKYLHKVSSHPVITASMTATTTIAQKTAPPQKKVDRAPLLRRLLRSIRAFAHRITG